MDDKVLRLMLDRRDAFVLDRGSVRPRVRKQTPVKVKRRRTADCVVGGFRYASGSDLVGSLLLGLYNGQDKLDHVGFTSGFADVDREALTARLEGLKGKEGFSGDAPGGPSRWATERSAAWTPLKPKLVVEVSFDHVSGADFGMERA